ncbi:MAG: flavin reductase family protein [Bryobacteraceae bacterium]|nr:flavin reductase family protein [Bryobacteraceae bacterium]MDW8377094.1 flavin reductase family protein [Bryobacterales bacterium]
MPETPLCEALFRQACSHFATGVAIAAVRDRSGAPHGLTVNSFTSVSMKPPLVLICVDKRAAILEQFLESDYYSVNILAAENEELSNRFATLPEHRFEGVRWRPGRTGAPLIEGSIASLECARKPPVEAGDHLILLAEAVAAEVHAGAPLLYFRSRYARLFSPDSE